jgi:hypothetical protein
MKYNVVFVCPAYEDYPSSKSQDVYSIGIWFHPLFGSRGHSIYVGPNQKVPQFLEGVLEDRLHQLRKSEKPHLGKA